MRFRKWTKEQLEEATKTATSIAMVLRLLELKPTGANYKTIKHHVTLYSFNTSHWRGQGHLKGKRHNWSTPMTLADICVENSTYNTNRLKQRLLKAGLLQNQCSICKQPPVWCGLPLTLVLDHINGINNDHRLENLRILCPHCHSQTSTFAGRNKKSK